MPLALLNVIVFSEIDGFHQVHINFHVIVETARHLQAV